MAENVGPKQPARGPGRRFQKGTSGNPRGKPKGTRHHITLMAERLMGADAKEIVEAVIKAAKGGDLRAAGLVLDRIVPVRKGRLVSLALPEISTPADIVSATAAIISAMAASEITPDEACAAVNAIEGVRRGLETSNIEQRLAALEAALSTKPPAFGSGR